eukprot:s6112_g1.t1
MALRIGRSIDMLEGEVAALVLEHLPLRTVQALMCAWRDVAVLLPKCLKTGASLWDWACAARQPFQLFRAMDGELCNCLQTVRADPRYSFHVQYWSVPHFLGSTENDRGLLWFVGSLRGWRPGQKEWNQATIAADTAPVFSLHFFPRQDDPSVHPSCTKPSRTPEAEDGSQEVAFYDSGMNDLVAVRARDPSLLMKRCGAASAMATSPVMTWLLLVHWKLLLGQPAYCLAGSFLGSGEFCLTSATFGGSDDELPVLELVVVSCGTWAPMASLLEELWAEAAWPSTEEGLPDCLNLAPEDVDNDTRSPSEMHQICAVQRFQKALYLRALAALPCEAPSPELFFGTKTGAAQGRSWKVRRLAAPGTELEELSRVVDPKRRPAPGAGGAGRGGRPAGFQGGRDLGRLRKAPEAVLRERTEARRPPRCRGLGHQGVLDHKNGNGMLARTACSGEGSALSSWGSEGSKAIT